jgi:hypothetical protein
MDSNTKNLQRVEAIFHEALAVEGEARAQLIDSRCNGDSDLAAEVRLLLNASEKEERLTALLVAERETGKISESAGRRIGPYELDTLLGRGGMGAVYLAHRADGEFEQKVAIKLIDLPLATTTFRERFRQERQILAGLEHPYIARLLDGGVTGSGDPYLVMEFVDGVPIHLFCERENLSLRQRLKLFLQVCEAVQFSGLWHRETSLAFVCRGGRWTDARGLPVLYAAICQPGASVGKPGNRCFRYLLAWRSAVSTFNRLTAL